MSESRKEVLKETAVIGLGELVCLGVMFGIYALIGQFTLRVLYSGLVGAVLTWLNYFSLAVIVTLAADRAERQDVTGGKKLVTASYPIRYILLGVILFLCGKSGYFDVLPLVLPLLFVRPVMMLAEFFRKKEGETK